MNSEANVVAKPLQDALGLREMKRRRTAEVIRCVAMDLFESRGYDETSVEEISRESMVSAPTVFRYFDSKDKIALLEVYEDLEWLERIFSSNSAITAFEALDRLNEIRCVEWTPGSMRDRATRILLNSPMLRDALSRLERHYRLLFIRPLELEFAHQADANMKARVTAAMLAGSTSAMVELLADAEKPDDVIRSASAFIRRTLSLSLTR